MGDSRSLRARRRGPPPGRATSLGGAGGPIAERTFSIAQLGRVMPPPRSRELVEQIQELVSGSRSFHALGSRHSFNDIADTTGDHSSLARLPRVIAIDPSGPSVRVDGGIRYGDLCGPLHAAGWGLHNLASLPHVSVAGACATATHGSGDRNGNLATAVTAISMVRGDGEIETVDRSDPDKLNGSVVALGALGIVTSLTLGVEPTYDVRQDVYEDLPFDELATHFDEIATLAYSVSLFTDWRGPLIDQVWLKTRVAGRDPAGLRPNCSVPLRRVGRAIRFGGCGLTLARPRAESQALGTTGSRISGLITPRALAMNSRLNTSWVALTRPRPCSRCDHCASELPE